MQDKSGSDLIDLSTGAVSGSFPLFDDFDYVTQESDGNLLVSGNGYVETIDPRRQRSLSTFGSSQIRAAGVHTGSGTQFYYPAQAVQGPDGTIYTADPLNTIEATSPQGYLEGSHHPRPGQQRRRQPGHGRLQLLSGRLHLLLPRGAARSTTARDNISTISLSTLNAYLGRRPRARPTRSGGGPACPRRPRPTTSPPGPRRRSSASFDPWWLSQASHLQLSYSVENTASLDAETVPTPTTIPLPTTAGGLADIPLTIPAADQQPGPYLVQASLFDTEHLAADAPRDHLHALHRRGHRGRTRPGQPPERHRRRGPDRSPGGGPQRPTRTRRAAGGHHQLEHLPPQLLALESDRGDVRPFGHDLRQRPDRLLQGRLPGPAGPRHLLAPGQRRIDGSVPTALVDNGWWKADVTALVSYYANGARRMRPVRPGDQVGSRGTSPTTPGGATAASTSARCSSPVLPGGQVGHARLVLDGHRRVVAQRARSAGGSS